MRIPLNEDENGSQNYVLTSLTVVMDMLIMNRSGVDDCPLYGCEGYDCSVLD